MWGDRLEQWPRVAARACPDLWPIIEAERPRLTRTVLAAAAARQLVLDTAALARLASYGDGPAQSAALCEASWAPYAHELEARGVSWAETGVELETWFGLLDAYQSALLEAPQLAQGQLREAAIELGNFVMGHTGRAYVATRGATGLATEVRLQILGELLQRDPTAMLVYRCEDRNDPGSFRLLLANAEAARISGPRLFAQVGQTLRQSQALRQTAHDLSTTEVSGHYAAAVRAGESRTWITAGTGSLADRTYETRCFPLGGDHVGVIYRDITEQRLLESERDRHLAELERSNYELDAFAYAASHDLKAPLQDVKTLSTWLREDLGAALPAGSARHMQTMIDRISRMERLLDDLLAYSRAGREPAPIQEFVIREVIEEAVALSAIPPSFSVRIEASTEPLRTPKSPLAQVIRNLLGNAIKHHDKIHGAIQIDAVAIRDRMHVAVSDDGPGIPAQFHERVFRIFQTLRPRDDVEGSGIGLAIVKKVVESHGGTVQIESTGRGTTVRFSWPRESKN